MIVIVFIWIVIAFAFIEALLSLAVIGGLRPFPGRDKRSYTVIVAARNENKTIRQCINALLQQRQLPDKIIIVDDHSDDDTFSVIQEFSRQNPLVEVVSLGEGESGKRAAVYKGIMLAATEIILTIDADCITKPSWAQALLDSLTDERRMVTGPVVINPETFRESLEYAELLFLVGTGAGVAWFGRMFQASGANMAFYKDDFKEFFLSAQGNAYRCGDDVFFLQFLHSKKGRKSADFCNNAAAVVSTHACSSTRDWIDQRIRWAGKSAGYSETTPFIIGGLVTLSNSAMLLAAVFVFLAPELRFFLIPGIIVKVMGDFLLMATASIAWKLRLRITAFLTMPLLYPFFMIRVASGLVFGKEKTWKGRKIR